ncbi:uncharacterized protein LOC126976458 [Leptidea sinapis]|uniref:uncharacterized protein LOC126976458 n=1 Tax=Leptidea sinapis TaxID=189913 RepID=UPI002142975E|nr:uncharacterized protein LOC126976458 [Leptidea sinapis]
MAKIITMKTDLESILENVDDYTIDSGYYSSIQTALEAKNSINESVVKKLLLFLQQNLDNGDKLYTVNNLNIISCFLNKLKDSECTQFRNQASLALCLLNYLKRCVHIVKIDSIKILIFDILLKFPEETLIVLVLNNSKNLFEVIELYCQENLPVSIRIQFTRIITKLLNILQPDLKKKFVCDGLDIWFGKILPTVLLAIPQLSIAEGNDAVTCCETLTEEIVFIDYEYNPLWEIFLECISTTAKYPVILINLLEKNNDLWHRLWIVFVRLLKNQITRSLKYGFPINAMLPVVENAFKMDVTNRCRAFKCWEALINNLCTETKDVNVIKRIKLLLTPLNANNAKHEEVAIAKFSTWWCFIVKYQTIVNKYFDITVVPYLTFCFGNSISNNQSNNPAIIPGMLSHTTKCLCIEGVADIFGHYKCAGCVSKKRLDGKIVNASQLVKHWKVWMHTLRSVFKVCMEIGEEVKNKAQCIWRSFIATLGDLPDNSIRRDLFFEILTLLRETVQQSRGKASEFIICDLLPILCDDDKKIRCLLANKGDLNAPGPEVLSIILDPCNELFYNSCGVEASVKILRSCSDCLLEMASKNSCMPFEDILIELPWNQRGLLIWAAIAESIIQRNNVIFPLLCELQDLMMWPFKVTPVFTNTNKYTEIWLSLYAYVINRLPSDDLEQMIFKMPFSKKEFDKTFAIRATLALINRKLEDEDITIYDEVEFLKKLVVGQNNNNIVPFIIPIIDTLKIILTKLTDNLKLDLFQFVFLIINEVLMLFKTCIEETTLKTEQLQLAYKELILTIADIVNSNVTHQCIFKTTIIEGLTDFCNCSTMTDTLSNSVLVLLKRHFDVNNRRIKVLIDKLENKDKNQLQDPETSKLKDSNNSFLSPNQKKGITKRKRKNVKIVDTVLDNGEEFVVVESNWKLNKKIMTDKQKEKFQRKGEDIPALYQDLSQSQDEFKQKTWRTDSMDTTSSSKSETSSENSKVSACTLKNIPNTEFRPKMVENIMNNVDVTLNSPKESSITKVIAVNNQENSLFGNKTSTSPRIALKDRVIKNVRNLIEKSNKAEGKNDLNTSLRENPCKTPQKMIKTRTSGINSAPSHLNSIRPSRMKRFPKKFDDTQVLLGRRRSSESRNQSQSQDDQTDDANIVEKSSLYEISQHCDVEINVPNDDLVVQDGDNIKITENTVTVKNKDYNTNLASPESNRGCTNDKQKEKNLSVETVPEINKQLENTEKKIEEIANGLVTAATALNENETDITDITLAKDTEILSTPKRAATTETVISIENSTSKKSSRKSRIEKSLAIDMVDGHPFLNAPSEKRARKTLLNTPCTRKKLGNIIKTDETDNDAKSCNETSDIVQSQNIEDIPASQDFIEGSQDSSVSEKSNKKVLRVRVTPISLSILNCSPQNIMNTNSSAESSENIENDTNLTNKPPEKQDNIVDLTENMDTEPITEEIIIDPKETETQMTQACNNTSEFNSQNTANADTQPMDPYLHSTLSNPVNIEGVESIKCNLNNSEQVPNSQNPDVTITLSEDSNALVTANETTKTITDSVLGNCNSEETVSSPFRDEEQRKQDFHNNTLEISPIKTLSPIRDDRTPSPETSKDYVVIQLSAPVQSNGEPIEKCNSPEIFTEDKTSPERRDLSPPRDGISVTTSSPSSSLSLKKNRPQVRPVGRSAQILGLCDLDPLSKTPNTDVLQDDGMRKSTFISTSVKRNLKNSYSNTVIIDGDVSNGNEESTTFLKLKRTLPSNDCSPAGPILKRKLADIADDASPSPASKKKRVSFHDPPVSTTLCVKKYIEPSGINSPQNSGSKRLERQMRQQTQTHKSQRRLDTAFKLDMALTNTIESFSPVPTQDTDTQTMDLDNTPVAVVTKTSDFNDTLPICPDLINCKDSIANVAAELSSPSMKLLLLNKIDDTASTVGDMAKMTELQISRLCIKAPKVETARKVLNNYFNKIKVDKIITNEESPNIRDVNDLENSSNDVEVLENTSNDVEVLENTSNHVEVLDNTSKDINSDMVENVAETEPQTIIKDIKSNGMQTDEVNLSHSSVQTDGSDSKSTEDIISSCLVERADFVQVLADELDETSKSHLASSLSDESFTNLVLRTLTSDKSSTIMDCLIAKASHNTGDSEEDIMSVIENYVCNKLDSKNLILLCSNILKKVYDKP